MYVVTYYIGWLKNFCKLETMAKLRVSSDFLATLYTKSVCTSAGKTMATMCVNLSLLGIFNLNGNCSHVKSF
jgi:hypothetical protein